MIQNRYLTVNRYSRSGKKLRELKGIVLHYVAAPWQTANQVRDYFESLKGGRTNTYASAHYVIGLDGEGVACVPVDEVAWHCGAREYLPGVTERLGDYPNYKTIGIELCHTATGFTEETTNAAAELCGKLMRAYNLGIDDLWRHHDITGKNCPKFWVDDKEAWERFKTLCDERRREIKG